MDRPSHGALGATFKAVRVLQAVCLIAVIGMTANFISQMVSSDVSPPDVLIGTLSVVSTHRIPAASSSFSSSSFSCKRNADNR